MSTPSKQRLNCAIRSRSTHRSRPFIRAKTQLFHGKPALTVTPLTSNTLKLEQHTWDSAFLQKCTRLSPSDWRLGQVHYVTGWPTKPPRGERQLRPDAVISTRPTRRLLGWNRVF